MKGREVVGWDRRYVWHPFTQMRDWVKREPIVIVRGRGAKLWDQRGREYLDANASIWTNLHGHRQPEIDRAVRRQLNQVAHVSALGLANEPAARLARDLVRGVAEEAPRGGPALGKVFFSDDGSTAMEVALKLAYEHARRERGERAPRFVSMDGAYHGDTVGAVSLGHIDLFHRAYGGLLFRTDQVMAPYCYRCPFNRARPERADAREYRRCAWECVQSVERLFARRKKRGQRYAGFVFEPLVQGAAGMIAQPPGWLQRAAGIAREQGALLIADEVMTGFGRTGRGGVGRRRIGGGVGLLASHAEGVQPDFVALAKGLTGGYLPMAATLTTAAVFRSFLGGYEEFRTFFHGHSYTGNPLGAAAAVASLGVLRTRASRQARWRLEVAFETELRRLLAVPWVGDIRRVGLIAGVELVRDWRTREAFPLAQRVGGRVTEAMAARGVLTRPIGNVVVLMPPYCLRPAELARIVTVLGDAIEEVLGGGPGGA